MKRLFAFIGILLLSFNLFATPGSDYVLRFMDYVKWSDNLPASPDNDFLNFITEDTPLAQKLREKWLYELAKQKNWALLTTYYKPSRDTNLHCFYLLANHYQGQNVFQAIVPIWLSGDTQPGACNQLFSLLLKNENFDESLITQRIHLALDKRNITLARYLLKQYQQPQLAEEKLLTNIYVNPNRISQLEPSDLHSAFYLYGLKRLVAENINQAVKIWQNPKTKQMLNEEQQQAVLAHIALYKAIRNHPDSKAWFKKVKPQYYTSVLLDWEIRLALKQQDWPQVERLINNLPDKDTPCWQYWLARAKEALGHKKEAQVIYEALANSRNYYGFLASLRLNKTFSFQNEQINIDQNLLKPYEPIIAMIKTLYENKETVKASRLLNDFVSELPKEDQIAVIHWVANELQWHGKSVYLSSNELLMNQLALRFPLAYLETISAYSQAYKIPKELIFAIIRQESGFRDDVVSAVGARGLMQIMPETASNVAKHEKIIYSDKGQLFTIQKNINIGVAYLQHLAKRFAKHPTLMAAAYNAGPKQVNRWLKTHPPKQIDIWIETLPWQETRNYIKNVIAFYAVYQYRMQQQPDIKAFMRPIL